MKEGERSICRSGNMSSHVLAGSILKKNRTVTAFAVEYYSANEVTLAPLNVASVTTLVAFFLIEVNINGGLDGQQLKGKERMHQCIYMERVESMKKAI